MGSDARTSDLASNRPPENISDIKNPDRRHILYLTCAVLQEEAVQLEELPSGLRRTMQ